MKPHFALVALLLTGCVTVQDKNGPSRFIESQSPTQIGTAIITKNIGWQDSAVIFEVRDPNKGAEPIQVGSVGDELWQGDLPKQAVWSRDGSVVAVQGADFKHWSHAYDFQNSVAIQDIYPPFKGNVAALLKQRGGAGAKVVEDWKQFDQIARPVEGEVKSRF